MNFNEIEIKHKPLIDIAKQYMNSIPDKAHDTNHMNDIVYYVKKLINMLNIDINKEVCIISSYWHDVGRTKLVDGHEKLSADMLKSEMEKQNYDQNFIDECYKAIENHKYNMTPITNEGLIVKDADKLAWLGKGRWQSAISNNQRLDEIIKLFPKLKEEILYFEESKIIYDKEIVKLIELFYQNLFK